MLVFLLGVWKETRNVKQHLGCFVTNLGQVSVKHILFFHTTECLNAQLCEKWSKRGSKEELTSLSSEEFTDRLEKHLHLKKKQREMSAH